MPNKAIRTLSAACLLKSQRRENRHFTVSNQFGFLDPTTDTVISPAVALQRLSARDKKRG